MFIVFCICSYSLHSKCFTRVRRQSWDKSKKEKWWVGEEKETFASKTPQFWKTVFAHERTFWLVRCWHCWLIVINTSLKPSMFCSGLKWSLVADKKCFGLIFIWIMFVQRFISDGKFIANDGVQIWLEKWTVCWRQHKLKSENWYSTQAHDAMGKWYVNFLKWKDSFWQELFDKG